MRRTLRLLAVFLVLVLASFPAAAESVLVPELTDWSWDFAPLRVDLSADVQVHMPYNDLRTQQLNALIKHLKLRLDYAEDVTTAYSSATLLVDGENAVSFSLRDSERRQEAQFSWMPGSTYAWTTENDVSVSTLLGGEKSTPSMALWDNEAWMDDALTLFRAMIDAHPEYVTVKNSKVTIKGMGTATQKVSFVVPKNKADGLDEIIASLCPEGEFRSLICSLTFTDRQALTVWRNDEGDIFRADWAGKAGRSAEDVRNVSLIWRLCRSDEQVKDDLKLRTPRTKGNTRNNVVFTREAVLSDTISTLEMEMSYEVVLSGDKNTTKVIAEMTRTELEQGPNLKGSYTVSSIPAKGDTDKMILMPDVIFTGDALTPSLMGVVGVERYRGKDLIEKADVTVSAGPSDGIVWDEVAVETVLDKENAATLSERLINGATVEVVRRLVLLPEEDVLFFSADLEPDIWQQIVDAARNALQ